MFFFAPGVESMTISRLLVSHFTWVIFALALLGFSPIIKNSAIYLMRKNKIFVSIIDLLLLITFILCIVRLSAATHNPFIYFQF